MSAQITSALKDGAESAVPTSAVKNFMRNPIGVGAGVLAGATIVNYALNLGIPRQNLFTWNQFVLTTADLAQVAIGGLLGALGPRIPVVGPMVDRVAGPRTWAAVGAGISGAVGVNKAVQLVNSVAGTSLPTLPQAAQGSVYARPGIVPFARQQPMSQAYFAAGSGGFRSQSGTFLIP